MAKGKYVEWLTQDGLIRIEGWAREGLTDEQIAQKIGIGTSTFYRWEDQFREFRDALKKGKAPVDIQVENALLKKALGFSVMVKKPFKLRTKKQLQGKGTIEEEKIEYAEEEMYFPPETAAAIFWLKNRRPDKWREKPTADSVTAPPDDGFLAALSVTASEDWGDDTEEGEDDGEEE